MMTIADQDLETKVGILAVLDHYLPRDAHGRIAVLASLLADEFAPVVHLQHVGEAISEALLADAVADFAVGALVPLMLLRVPVETEIRH